MDARTYDNQRETSSDQDESIESVALQIPLGTAAPNQSEINADSLYLGQDRGIESIGLQITLGEKDDLIYHSLLWHYRIGVRHFEIRHQGLTPSQSKKIDMFYGRVTDSCSLNAITLYEGSEVASTLPRSLKWVFHLTDRQFLCLHKPLAEILSENESSTLVLPSCFYGGFDPEAPISFWPQTDERLNYRSPIDYEHPVSLLNKISPGVTKISNTAHIASFATMEDAVPYTTSMVKDQLPFNANPLYLGQDAGVESIGLQITLGEKDDLIYSSLLWHYRIGVRHFEIRHQGLTPSQSKKIDMFYERVTDICSLNTITLNKGSEVASTLPRSLKWVFHLTDRQFLCLHEPLTQILSENESSTLVLPSCFYGGFDPEAPISFWPQTDERLIYHSPIDYEHPVSLLNKISPNIAKTSNTAHIASFATMEGAVPYTTSMVKNQLPFLAVNQNSARHACLRGQEYWKNGNFIEPIIQTPQEEALDSFIRDFGDNSTIRFGKNYIYVPVQKSGCTSIAVTLGSYELNRKINFPAYKDFNRFPIEIADRYQRLLSDKLYKFTCVRDPYNRALSAYLDKIYLKKIPFLEELNFEKSEEVSFVNFLKRLKSKEIREIDPHFKPQWCLTMCPLVCYNKVIHLENFSEEFQEVMNHIGIPGNPNDYSRLEHATNASSRLSEFYTQECVSLVQEIYEKDFEYFCYDKIPNFPLLKS